MSDVPLTSLRTLLPHFSALWRRHIGHFRGNPSFPVGSHRCNSWLKIMPGAVQAATIRTHGATGLPRARKCGPKTQGLCFYCNLEALKSLDFGPWSAGEMLLATRCIHGVLTLDNSPLYTQPTAPRSGQRCVAWFGNRNTIRLAY